MVAALFRTCNGSPLLSPRQGHKLQAGAMIHAADPGHPVRPDADAPPLAAARRPGGSECRCRAAPAREADRPRQAWSCVLFLLHGGPSQLDIWDMKPDCAGGGARRVPPRRHQRPRRSDHGAAAARRPAGPPLHCRPVDDSFGHQPQRSDLPRDDRQPAAARADRRLAEFAGRDRHHPQVPGAAPPRRAERRAGPTPAPGRPAGRQPGTEQGQGVGRRPRPHRHGRLRGGPSVHARMSFTTTPDTSVSRKSRPL